MGLRRPCIYHHVSGVYGDRLKVCLPQPLNMRLRKEKKIQKQHFVNDSLPNSVLEILSLSVFNMRFTSLLAAAFSLAATGVSGTMVDWAIPAHIKPGDNFTVHIYDSISSRLNQDRLYWGLNRADPSAPFPSKVGMKQRFHETNMKWGGMLLFRATGCHCFFLHLDGNG